MSCMCFKTVINKFYNNILQNDDEFGNIGIHRFVGEYFI